MNAPRWSRLGGAMALVLVALSGCGRRGPEVPAPAWSAVDAPGGGRCGYAAALGSVPAFRDMTRAGTLGNVSLWGRGMAPDDTVELSIRYADDGKPHWVRAVRSTVDTARVAALEQLVLEAMVDSAAADWGVRVLVAGGDVRDVAPSVICEPIRIRHTGTLENIPLSREVFRDLYALRGRPIPVQVMLDERGWVLGVELVRRTESHWVNQFIVDFVRNSRYEPKLHDGIGVATTYQFDLRFPTR